MNYFQIGHTLQESPIYQNSLHNCIEFSFDQDHSIIDKSILIVDDGSATSISIIKELLGLHGYSIRSKVFYLGSCTEPERMLHSDEFSRLQNYFATIIFIGFENIGWSQKIKKQNVVHNISSKVKFDEDYDIINIGYQRHLNSNLRLHPLSKGLGSIKYQSEQEELIFREQHYFEFNLDVVKRCEIPTNTQTQINGIFSEDFCRLLKTCGSTAHTKILKICGVSEKGSSLEYELVADGIWYFLEGTNINLYELPSSASEMKEILLQSSDLNHDYSFIRSTNSNKLWFKTEVKGEELYIPCTEEDFNLVCKDQIPERLLDYI